MIACTFSSFLNLQDVNWGLRCHRLEVMRQHAAFQSKCKGWHLFLKRHCSRAEMLQHLHLVSWMPWHFWKSQLPMADCTQLVSKGCISAPRSACVLQARGHHCSSQSSMWVSSFSLQLWNKAVFLRVSFMNNTVIFWLFIGWLFCS